MTANCLAPKRSCQSVWLSVSVTSFGRDHWVCWWQNEWEDATENTVGLVAFASRLFPIWQSLFVSSFFVCCCCSYTFPAVPHLFLLPKPSSSTNSFGGKTSPGVVVLLTEKLSGSLMAPSTSPCFFIIHTSTNIGHIPTGCPAKHGPKHFIICHFWVGSFGMPSVVQTGHNHLCHCFHQLFLGACLEKAMLAHD